MSDTIPPPPAPDLVTKAIEHMNEDRWQEACGLWVMKLDQVNRECRELRADLDAAKAEHAKEVARARDAEQRVDRQMRKLHEMHAEHTQLREALATAQQERDEGWRRATVNQNASFDERVKKEAAERTLATVQAAQRYTIGLTRGGELAVRPDPEGEWVAYSDVAAARPPHKKIGEALGLSENLIVVPPAPTVCSWCHGTGVVEQWGAETKQPCANCGASARPPAREPGDRHYDALIHICELLQVEIDHVQRQMVDTEKGRVRFHFADFDAGHLAAAGTLIRAAIDPDYPLLKESDERAAMQRVMKAVGEVPPREGSEP